MSLGSGPGFDLVGTALVSEFDALVNGRALPRVKATILDYEAGWSDCVFSVTRALTKVPSLATILSSSAAPCLTEANEKTGPPRYEVDFGLCDITKPLGDCVNAPARAAIREQRLDIIILTYVVAENKIALRESDFCFFQNLANEAPKGTAILLLETTHRLWPEILAACYRGLTDEETTFDVAFPRLTGRRGVSMCLVKRSKGAVVSERRSSQEKRTSNPSAHDFGSFEWLLERMSGDFEERNSKVWTSIKAELQAFREDSTVHEARLANHARGAACAWTPSLKRRLDAKRRAVNKEMGRTKTKSPD